MKSTLINTHAWDDMRRTRMTKKQRLASVLAVRGTWIDRPEWKKKSSAQIAIELRSRASRRGRDD